MHSLWTSIVFVWVYFTANHIKYYIIQVNSNTFRSASGSRQLIPESSFDEMTIIKRITVVLIRPVWIVLRSPNTRTRPQWSEIETILLRINRKIMHCPCRRGTSARHAPPPPRNDGETITNDRLLSWRTDRHAGQDPNQVAGTKAITPHRPCCWSLMRTSTSPGQKISSLSTMTKPTGFW